FWTITAPDRPDQADRADRVVAVNADRAESRLKPAEALLTATRTRQPGEPTATSQSTRRALAIGPLLAVLLLELLVAHRRRGVGRGQWRLAGALRVAIAGLLVVALFDPHTIRSADRVAVVFLLDGSASLGSAGRSEASAFVRDAI